MQVDGIDKIRKNLSTLLIAAVVMAVVIWAGYGYLNFTPSRYAATSAEQNQIVSVAIDYGDGSYLKQSVAVAASATVFNAIQQLASDENLAFEYKTYPGLGVLVTKIGPKANGEDGAYWQYWVNGVYAEKAADQTVVQAGNSIEWKFSAQQQ